jgi:type IV pilus assembly protein PilC
MATMVSAGVSVLDLLAITAQVAGNAFYATIWTTVAGGVRQGGSLSEGLVPHRLVPRTITQMISAGEKTGRLAMVMDRVAAFCESDLRVAVKTATSMIEPVMIIVMGLVIGAIVLALLLPVFSISRVVAH